MFAPSCRQKVTFRCGLVQKKESERKKEDLARYTASGVFQGFRSVSGTVHAVVKKDFTALGLGLLGQKVYQGAVEAFT